MTERSPLPDDHPVAVLARRVAHLCNVVRLRLAAGAIVAENAIHVRALRTNCDRFLALVEEGEEEVKSHTIAAEPDEDDMTLLIGTLPRAKPVPDMAPIDQPETEEEEPMLTIGILSAHRWPQRRPCVKGQVAVFDPNGDPIRHFFLDQDPDE